jgi:predicted amidophosphoribosyltransferase
VNVKRICAHCGREYIDDADSQFVTCPSCRRPVTGDCGGGCRVWRDAAPDPRVTRAEPEPIVFH